MKPEESGLINWNKWNTIVIEPTGGMTDIV